MIDESEVTRLLLQYFLHAANLSIFQSYLNAAMMFGCTGEQIFHDSFCECPGTLIFFQNDHDVGSFFNIRSYCSVHAICLMKNEHTQIFTRPGNLRSSANEEERVSFLRHG